MAAFGKQSLGDRADLSGGHLPCGRKAIQVAQNHGRRVVSPRRIDAHESERALEQELDGLMGLANHVVVAPAGQEEP
jgi:hypothetical protein